MDEDSSETSENGHYGRNESRKRKWYRKRVRDPNFRKRQELDNSSYSSEENSGEGEERNSEESSVDAHSEAAVSMDDENASENSQAPEVNELVGHDELLGFDEAVGHDEAAEDNGGVGHDEEVIGGDYGLDLHCNQPQAENQRDENESGESDGDSDERDAFISEEELEASDAQEGSEEGSGEEEEEEVNNDNTPIFNGATVTFRESALAILTFILSHKLTGLCLIDLLLLLSLHCGRDNIILKTMYKFKKYFQMIGQNFIKLHYYCSNCEILLPGKNAVCCADQQLDTYFIEFPIIKQLENLFARTGFYEDLQYRFNRVKKDHNNVEDIYDGTVYQQLFNTGFLNNPNNISFFMYFDGIAVFKSSNFSIWPAYLTINELRYKLRTRKENSILAGLWFGKKKPNPNLFLRPIYDFFVSFEAIGANFTLPNGDVINVKGKIIGAVADLPAKALFMRFIQYNGAFSCSNCMQHGGRFGLGNTTIQVFPYEKNIGLRENNETVEFASQAIAARQHDPDATVYGVKGPSLLSSLLPNMILCMGIDIMHGVFLGVMKTLNSLWFDGVNSEYPFSISNMVHLVDAKLKSIKPPHSFQNMPCRIKKDKWKAFDLKAFFFYYSLVVLNGIIPDRYWFHHVRLVTAISILCQEGISPEDFVSAETILHTYVSDFQVLYGVRHMTLTFHQLLHLPLVCKNLGPAWVFSCFFYESLNGELSRLVHGTRHVALQICSSSSIFMKLPVMINNMPDSAAKELCLKFQGRLRNRVKITENIDIQTGVVGKMKVCHPVPEFICKLLRDNYNILGGRYKYFYRLKRKSLVYTCQLYARSIQKKSCYVEIFYNNVPYLCKVHVYIRWSSCTDNCPNGCNNCPKQYFCVVTLYDRLIWELHDAPLENVLPHLNKVSPQNGFHVFPVESIRSMCIYMSFDDKEYISLPVNNLEVE
ncbi:Halomucin [Frankliniella fusca]|uniref:Halomucin n=1 Tax=Frankliniella fusca TaxID=407009 RepID=A0AAE1HF21_9NEOP|nr:Halomucin [Frankliniella fusca]